MWIKGKHIFKPFDHIVVVRVFVFVCVCWGGGGVVVIIATTSGENNEATEKINAAAATR